MSVWRVGELAVCITDVWYDGRTLDRSADVPRIGQVLRVSLVGESVAHGHRYTMLAFEGRFAGSCFAATGFRKPVTDETGVDATVEAMIRRAGHAPVRESVDA